MDITDRFSPSDCSEATRNSLKGWNIKKFSWGSIPTDPPNIIKLMSITSFFTDGKKYYSLCPPLDENPKWNPDILYTLIKNTVQYMYVTCDTNLVRTATIIIYRDKSHLIKHLEFYHFQPFDLLLWYIQLYIRLDIWWLLTLAEVSLQHGGMVPCHTIFTSSWRCRNWTLDNHCMLYTYTCNKTVICKVSSQPSSG